jgi:hypothetical protein
LYPLAFISPLAVLKKMQKSHFFVSRKQNVFHPSVILGAAMNKFGKWTGCRESRASPPGGRRDSVEPRNTRTIRKKHMESAIEFVIVSPSHIKSIWCWPCFVLKTPNGHFVCFVYFVVNLIASFRPRQRRGQNYSGPLWNGHF